MNSSWTQYKPVYIGSLALITLVGIIVVWASRTHISGAIIGTGIVQVDENQHAVSHQKGGTISAIYVQNGDLVAQDSILLTLDSTELDAELGTIEGELYETLTKEARLQAELSGATTITLDDNATQLLQTQPDLQERLHRQQIQMTSNIASMTSATLLLEKKIDQIYKQVTGTQAQIAAKQKQIALLAEDIERDETAFKKGLIKYSLLSANKDKMAATLGDLGELTAKEAELNEKIIEHQIDIVGAQEKFKNTAIDELNKIQAQKVKLLESRKATIEQINNLSIRAPINGRVHDAKLYGIRSVIKPGVEIMKIVPDNKPTFVAVKIDVRDIENIYPGQSALLKFKSFNLRNIPMIEGSVINISPDVYIDAIKKRPYYEVHIEISQTGLEDLHDKVLVQGMPVEGYITTRNHTPLEYIASPVLAYFDRALR